MSEFTYDLSEVAERLISAAEGDSFVVGGHEWWVADTADPVEFLIEKDDTGEQFRVRILLEVVTN